MKQTPKQMIQVAREFGWESFLEESPVTGNPRLKYPAVNDVMAVVELLGGTTKAAEFLGVEEIEVEHWQDDHYVPTRYVVEIQKRFPRWSLWSLQTPPFDQEASVAADDAMPVQSTVRRDARTEKGNADAHLGAG